MSRPAPGALDHIVAQLALTTPRTSGGGGARPNGGGSGGSGGDASSTELPFPSSSVDGTSPPVLVDGPLTVHSGGTGSVNPRVGETDTVMDIDVEDLTRDGSFVGEGGAGFIRSPTSGSPGETLASRQLSVTFDNQAQGARGRATDKLYVVSRLPVELDAFQAVCRSVKGRSNISFCVEKNCTVNHQGSSLVPLKPGDLYVVNHPGKTGFVEPTLSHKMVGEDLLGEFLSSQRSIDNWRADFERVVSASADALEGIVSKRDYEVVLAEESLAMLDAVKTPARATKKSRTEGDNDDYPRASWFPGMEFFDDDVSITERMGKVVEALKDLDAEVGNLFSKFTSFSTKEADNVEQLARMSRNVYLKVKMLKHDVLGTCPPTTSMELGSNTVWGAVTALLDMVRANRSLSLQRQTNPTDISPILNRLQQIEQGLFDVARGTQAELNALRVSPMPGRSDPTDDLQDVKRQLAELQSASEKKPIKFGNLGFDSMTAAGSWLELHLPAHDIGFITDPHTVMENVFASGDSDFMKDFEKVAKLEIQSLSKGVAMKSFQQAVPKYFCKASTTVVDTDGSYFSRILKVEDWTQSETGYLAQLRRTLTTFELGQRESIALTFGKTSPVRTLALLSLSESVTFISSLLDFMKEYMEHLTEAKFSQRKAYHVATRVVVRVWKELFLPRQGVMSSFVANNHDLNSLQIFWASLRSLDIAMEMRRVGIENHHLVASELVKFLTLHSGSSDVGALVTKVTGLTSSITELKSSVNGAQAAATTASNKANEALRAAQGGGEGGNRDSRAVKTLKDDIKSLKRRLDALEGAGDNP